MVSRSRQRTVSSRHVARTCSTAARHLQIGEVRAGVAQVATAAPWPIARATKASSREPPALIFVLDRRQSIPCVGKIQNESPRPFEACKSCPLPNQNLGRSAMS